MKKNDFKLIKKLCMLDYNKLKIKLKEILRCYQYDVTYTDDYIYAEGDLPVCLIAHMDTVFEQSPRFEDFYCDPHRKVLWAAGGAGFDDRAGIYAILKLIQMGYRPSIVFTNGEEIGCVGAQALVKKHPKCPFEKCNFLVQLDRAGRNDMVFYQCDNSEFEEYIESFGFKFNRGTFSDISVLGPAWGIAAVNLSIGYENEHSIIEMLHYGWCEETIHKVSYILAESKESLFFKYIPMDNSVSLFHNNFDIQYKDKCIICDKELTKEDKFTNSEISPYYCCKSCWNTYYNNRDCSAFDF